MQGAVERSRGHDLHRFGLLYSPAPEARVELKRADGRPQTYSDKHAGLELGMALNRVGHHIREMIVQQARISLGEMEDMAQQARLDVPEPIPEDQEEINKQADAAIRDLFPRIPNTDRQIIIDHAFKKVCPPN